ncbi:MAG TPA: hypothetical protein VIY30_15475 [Burkholderiaceae bacterium]
MSSRWPIACARALLLVWGVAAGTASQAQPIGDAGSASRESFRICDAMAFLALNIARNYMMTGRDRQAVVPHLKGDAAAEAMAEAIFRRVDADEIRHPGEVAADVLFDCAAQQKMSVGASRQQVALCFTRTDIVFFLHTERSNHVVRQTAVSKVQARLKSRELYPAALISSMAEAVYTPPELPDLRQMMGRVAWTCINRPPLAASAASR